MNKYELALVLTPALDEEARTAEVSKVQALLERFGGKIEKVDEWGKRKLAYEIKKVNEGFFSFTTLKRRHLLQQKLKAVSVLWKMFFVILSFARMHKGGGVV